MDMKNDTVIVQTKACASEMSVDEQRHFASDSGNIDKEIVSITTPKKYTHLLQMSFDKKLMQDHIQRKIITTADGSKTIHLPQLNEHYHSKHGAINEAKHVFIEAGFNYILSKNVFNSLHILEIGFGTGLNAFMTFLEAKKTDQKINYVGVEAYPVSISEAKLMKYPDALSEKEKTSVFNTLHESTWEDPFEVTSNLTFTKKKQFFIDIEDQNYFDLIYFDAFGARVQPELWTVEIFEKMYNALRPNGVLVTYAAKGSVRRAMQEVGFETERLPGPPGKREMLRATKKDNTCDTN